MNAKKQILDYVPHTEEESQAKQTILSQLEIYGRNLLERDCPGGAHFTCSGMILDEQMTHTLMVHHNIYQSFSWTGGHADGDDDFLAVAVREAKEETNVRIAEPISSRILSIDILPVKAHEKNGKAIAAHLHYNITYGLTVPKTMKIAPKPDENSAAAWIPIEKIAEVCKETHMIPIYKKVICRMKELRLAQETMLASCPELLLPWYRENARDLPWRKDKNPYHVWVSEVMLQQTRVEVVKEYYIRFLSQFPDVYALAAADDDTVHKAWEGLGYYSRARNMQKAAKELCRRYDGCFPADYDALRGLPGIGNYTAGAVCSICFGAPTPAVDGNVLRVFMRLTEGFHEIERDAVRLRVFASLQKLYPADNGDVCGTLTQAFMELGATVCIPNGKPHCTVCPLHTLCMSHKNGTAESLPVHKEKSPRKQVDVTVFVLTCGEYYAICRRPMYGLLAGMWELPNVEQALSAQEQLQQAKDWGCQPLSLEKSVSRTHIFTHLQWNMTGIYISCGKMSPIFEWKTQEELASSYAIPTAFQKILR